MIRVLHTGDLHLDSPFRGLNAEKAQTRREEQRGLLDKIAALTEERGIDVVLIAGDLFDGDGVYYETTRMLAEVFGRMKARIFIAPGNHDPYSDFSPYASVRWPDNVHIFHSDYFERVELPELNAVVYGNAFTSKYRDTSPLEHFKPDYDEGLTRLMVFHGDLNAVKSRYGAVTAEQIAATGMDYAALGHVHSFTEVWSKEGTSWAYCGCPEGRGFDELGEKGFYVGVLEDSGAVSLTFVPFAGRKYEILEVNVTGQDPRAAIEAALPLDTSRDLYRIILTGETGAGGVHPSALQEALAGRFYTLEIRDRTHLAEDLWARAEEDSLRGLFLKDLKARLDAAETDEVRQQITMAARFGLAALDHRDLDS